MGHTLLRRECTGGVLASDHAVANNVGSISVACAPAVDCSGTPKYITVSISSVADSTGHIYTYSLTGTFEKAIGDGAPPSPPAPIFLLGAGNCSSGATGIVVSGGSALRIYGEADINSGDIAGGSGCTSMSLGTNAGNYLAGDTQIFSGVSGGTCDPNGSSTCPTITNYSPALTDPYANLPALSGVPAGACSGTNPSPVGTAYPPGVYPQLLSIPSTATFSGTYIFCAGVSFTNGARITGSNVLFYLKGGTLSVGGDSQVALSAATSGSYKGLVVWQAAGDATTMLISNGGQFALTGAIYAPSAQVKFTGGSVTTSVTSIVSKTIYLSGGATVTIGAPSSVPLSFSLPAGLLTAWPKTIAYSSPSFTGVGGDGNYSWSASNLPTGLSMDPGTGVISGTPSVVGAKSVTVTLSDALGDDVATQTFTLTINAIPTVTSTSPTPRGQGAVGQSIAINGTGFINGAVASFSGTGITVNSTTWNSATKVTANVDIGPNASTGARDVTVTNPDTGTATKTSAFTVNAAPSITTASLSNGVNGTAYSKTVAGSGGTTPYVWSATGLPVGLSIASGTGVITGTPTASGAYTVAVTLTDAVGGRATTSYAVTIQPMITSVALTNKASGGTAGKMEAGDKITVVYSDVMKVSSFCSTWSGDASNQTLTGNGLLVNVSDGTGATNDVLTISTSSGCTFNFGSINLGSNAYVSTAATFGGASGNTTIAWTASTDTLVITLGSQTGTSATVGSTSPVYAVSPALVDTTSLAIGNSPFTVSPAAVRF